MHLFGLDEEVDLMFSMSYDQGAPQHSSRELAKQTLKQADNANLVMSKLCLGVPFYGRNNHGEMDDHFLYNNNFINCYQESGSHTRTWCRSTPSRGRRTR